MRRAYKYRIYPTKSQAKKLDWTFEMCRRLYNLSLNERIIEYKTNGCALDYNDQQNSLPALKEKIPKLKEVNAKVLQDVLRRLDKAYKNFYRKHRLGEKGGFPKFKKFGQWRSITDPQYRTIPSDNKVRFSKIGMIKAKYHRPIPKNADIKTLTIIKEANKWFAVFSLDFGNIEKVKTTLKNPIGIDLGLVHFFYPSSGRPVSAPKYFRADEPRIKHLQSKLSKSKKKTKRYYKTLNALRKANYRVRCKRNDFLHKTANTLLKKSDLIIHEDLDIVKMMRRPEPIKDEKTGEYLRNGACIRSNINKSISDAAWKKFLLILKYKAEKKGKKVVSVDPDMTTEICSECGNVVRKSLSTRTHLCNFCGYSDDRDKNAAKNILRLGLESLGLTLDDAIISNDVFV